MAPSTATASHLIERLKSSPFYQICQDSFRKATGLPLVIINAHDAQFNPCHTSPNQNPFCRGLNLKHGTKPDSETKDDPIGGPVEEV